LKVYVMFSPGGYNYAINRTEENLSMLLSNISAVSQHPAL